MTAARRARTALAAGAAALLLAGCTGPVAGVPPVTPWAVADHDEKVAYHASAGDALLGVDATAGIAALERFQATGYQHLDTETNATANYEYRTSVDGEGYVTQRVTDDPGNALDASHEAGSPYTYYLIGDDLKGELSGGKSWVQVSSGDLGRLSDPAANCGLASVRFLCLLIEAWNVTRADAEQLPVQLAEGENGQRHFATAVSYDALAEVGLIPKGGLFGGFVSAESRAKLIPLHVWVAADGTVTKIESNGVLSGDGAQTLKLQIGFELTGREASAELLPVADEAVPANNVLRITTSSQVEAFAKRLTELDEL